MDSAGAAQWRRAADLISVAVGIVGVTFGVLADAAGVSLAKTIVMSAFVFTGASQFAVVSSIDAGSSALAAFGGAILLASRNALYGAVVADLLPTSRVRRVVAAQFVIDETTAMAAAQTDPARARSAFWRTAIGLWICWNLGTILGHVLGSVMGETSTWGLDVAFAASFVAMLGPHLRSVPGRVAAVGGAALALGGVLLLPAGGVMIAAVLAVIPAYLVGRRT